VLDVNADEQRVSLSIKSLEEPKVEKHTEKPQETPEIEEATSGFSLGDMIGDQLKKYK
jgi:small subunit ribosomal protein S1